MYRKKKETDFIIKEGSLIGKTGGPLGEKKFGMSSSSEGIVVPSETMVRVEIRET